MESYQSWNEWKTRRAATGPLFSESRGQRPDYSFDSWIKMTKELGDEMSSFVTQSKEKDQELDDEIKAKKKEPKPDPEDLDPKEKENKESAWKRLRDIAKERQQKDKEKDGAKKPSKKSPASS